MDTRPAPPHVTSRAERPREPVGQIVLVLQGGGALGAYQAGVYQALHEAGIEPDWVIGTSIGAINAALIAGNAPADRLRAAARLLGQRRSRPDARQLGQHDLARRTCCPTGRP